MQVKTYYQINFNNNLNNLYKDKHKSNPVSFGQDLDSLLSQKASEAEDIERRLRDVQANNADLSQTIAYTRQRASAIRSDLSSLNAEARQLATRETRKDEQLQDVKNEARRIRQEIDESRTKRKKLEEKQTELTKRFKKSERQRKIDFKEQLSKQRARLERLHKAKIQRLANQTVNSGVMQVKKGSKSKIFGDIVGYREHIKALLDVFATPITLEREGKKANVPNGLLFFGPDDVGKTTLAESFAKELNCAFIKLKSSSNPEEDLNAFQEALIAGQQQFEKDKTRTIILIDDFDSFAPQGSRIGGILKDLMDTVSSDYHCTVFAATEHPENINDILLRDGRFLKLPVPPANKKNAAAILRHYAAGHTYKNVDFNKLAQLAVSVQPKEAFSNSQLRDIVEYLIQITQGKLSQKALAQSIKNRVPMIKEAILELFRRQVEYMRGL